ncbi:DNA mismatch repair protein MutS [Gluconacetobacter takamatsuzukensis]|uniref:DNA mismatch repair protein MutS n=1 Tax=Gluconacetobacter takamatsuzukensis TaxID=1286190 RepID=A0A7W4KCS2_9PROT|nr:DNA mismatch repair protein MutS [Gluconacetobacter takamatsuzukensis]MBB2204559.1 DNA mismatch repair protein MutS [Gluconacetobacter takamatsuzukensis]
MTLPSPDGATPAMAQWFSLKAEHPEALLFFRMGDFYEMFFSDAEAASAALDIALTTRGTHGDMPIPMCGVPVAAASAYLARLIRRGFRVAVAEQTEPPRKPGKGVAKGPLARAVVRLVTPGTLTEDELLEAGRQNLLVAVAAGAGRAPAGRGWGVAWIDISTGAFETASVPPDGLMDLLGRLDPAEILAAGGIDLGDFDARRAPEATPPAPATARRRVAETFEVASLDAFGTFSDEEAIAAAMALDYVRRSQAGQMPRLAHPHAHENGGILGLDPATRASLDLLRTRDGTTEHTLLASVGRTVTAPGSRLLAEWIAAPLTRCAPIAARQDGWSWLIDEGGVRAALRQGLRGTPDIARALARLSLGRGLPRDAAAVRDGLSIARRIASSLADGRAAPPALIADAMRHLGGGTALEDRLKQALAESLPARVEDGGVIAPGFDPELDAERGLRDDSRRIIAGLQNDYAQEFGVASLKIRHHAQLGYVIEIPTAAATRVRERTDLILRQGTASAARFSTDELITLDRRIAEAGERASARERGIFATLVRDILAEPAVPAIAHALAVLDVLQSCADLAAGGLWCRPEVTDDAAFTLTGCRHPVVEAALPRSERFTPNDCVLEPAQRVMLLTGPNMAGKSTFLRQGALAVILAQAGLPVPARAARIGIVDRLFSRVGASDDLARGRSTFMVEMTETAAILNQAGPRSLVVVDEIGRGTATLDGLAIAWAVLEAMHSTLRCRSIFATHFHELAELAESLPRLSPHTMSVREWKGQVVFQHEVVPGSARRSWGVHVARLAGVPEPVVRRAARLLAGLEKERAVGARPLPLFASTDAPAAPEPVDPAEPEVPEAVRQMLEQLDPDALTPRSALDMVYALKKLMLEESRHLDHG